MSSRLVKPALVGLILALASGAGAEELTATQPGQIAYREIGPHGVGIVSWLLHANGDGTYRSDRDGPSPIDASFSLGAAGYQEVLAIIAPLEHRREMACTISATDQAIGILTWLYGIQHISVHVDFGCRPEAGEDMLDRVEQVNSLIRGSVGVSQSNDGSLPFNPGPGVMPEGGVPNRK